MYATLEGFHSQASTTLGNIVEGTQELIVEGGILLEESGLPDAAKKTATHALYVLGTLFLYWNVAPFPILYTVGYLCSDQIQNLNEKIKELVKLPLLGLVALGVIAFMSLHYTIRFSCYIIILNLGSMLYDYAHQLNPEALIQGEVQESAYEQLTKSLGQIATSITDIIGDYELTTIKVMKQALYIFTTLMLYSTMPLFTIFYTAGYLFSEQTSSLDFKIKELAELAWIDLAILITLAVASRDFTIPFLVYYTITNLGSKLHEYVRDLPEVQEQLEIDQV